MSTVFNAPLFQSPFLPQLREHLIRHHDTVMGLCCCISPVEAEDYIMTVVSPWHSVNVIIIKMEQTDDMEAVVELAKMADDILKRMEAENNST